MVNPAFPNNQMVGVFNLELARMYSYLYQKSQKNYAIVHAIDGYDEVSLTGNVKVLRNRTEQVLTPGDFETQPLHPSQIFGGSTVESSAEIFLDILKGKGSEAQNKVTCANAGLAISVSSGCSLIEGIRKAEDSLMNGKALSALNTLQKLSEN